MAMETEIGDEDENEKMFTKHDEYGINGYQGS